MNWASCALVLTVVLGDLQIEGIFRKLEKRIPRPQYPCLSKFSHWWSQIVPKAMYAIFPYISLHLPDFFSANLGEHSIHGAYMGYETFMSKNVERPNATTIIWYVLSISIHLLFNLNEVSLPLAFWVEENHHVVNHGMKIPMEPNTEDEGDVQVPC